MKKGLILYPQMSQLCIEGSVRLSVEKLSQAKYVIKTEKFTIAVHVLQKNDFVISRCCFAEDGQRNIQRFKTHV